MLQVEKLSDMSSKDSPGELTDNGENAQSLGLLESLPESVDSLPAKLVVLRHALCDLSGADLVSFEDLSSQREKSC